MSEQKFHAGDLVRIADDLGPEMEHFTSGCDAIVIGSYADQFDGDNDESYTLDLEKGGQCSWYYGHQLTLIEHNRHDLLAIWKAAREEMATQESDLDWIFANGEAVLHRASGATVGALGKILGCDNLWGSNGEGMTYYTNARAILLIAMPYLLRGDRAGFEALGREAAP